MATPFYNGLQLVPLGATGAPTAGTWPLGAMVCDSAGTPYRCTVAGTPGTWVSMAAGAVSVSTAEVDFGTTPAIEQEFTVTDAAVSATSKIMVLQGGQAATGREANEALMDQFHATAVPGTGSFTLHVKSFGGPVVGKYKFNYLVG